MKKALALALFGLAAAAQMTAYPVAAQSIVAEQSVTFAVANMTCALCPVTVKRAMESVEGVRAVEVNLEAKTATVVFDTGMTDAGVIAEASANAGYPAVAGG